MVGEGARLLVSRVLAAGGAREDLDAAFARFSAIYDRRLADHTRPYPGVVAGLERLAERFTLAVLTNKPQHHTDRLLDALDLRRYFVQALGGDTAHGRKPDPAGLTSLVGRGGRGAGGRAAGRRFVGRRRDRASRRDALLLRRLRLRRVAARRPAAGRAPDRSFDMLQNLLDSPG